MLPTYVHHNDVFIINFLTSVMAALPARNTENKKSESPMTRSINDGGAVIPNILRLSAP